MGAIRRKFPAALAATLDTATGLATDASHMTTSAAGRIVASLGATTARRVLCVGDSLTSTGGGYAPGTYRTRLADLCWADGVDIEFVGPVCSGHDGYVAPLAPMCAGYAGETIAQVTTRFEAGGSIHAYVAAFGAPDLIVLRVGTNDVSGSDAATVRIAKAALAAAIAALCPSAGVVDLSIPYFYLPAAPGVGLATVNARIAQVNTDGATDAATRTGWTFVDSCAGFGRGESAAADGTHLRPHAHAMEAARIYPEIRRRYPISRAAVMPRPFRYRAQKSSVVLTNKATDKVITTADNGWRLPAGNFWLSGEFLLSDLQKTAGDIPTLLSAYPSGANYTDGFMLAYSTTDTRLRFYAMTGSALATSPPTPIVESATALYQIGVHGDRANGIISFWCGMPASPRAGAPWAVSCIGAVTGVAAWPQGTANPLMSIGAHAYGGFGGAARNVVMKIAGVPSFEAMRPEIVAQWIDGAGCPGASGSLPCDDASGATCASAVGGAAGTLTGAWSAAGAIAWPYDE